LSSRRTAPSATMIASVKQAKRNTIKRHPSG
jgi:hypothetical protein